MAKQKMKFEEAFRRLEEIVAELESGDLSLDESLAKYEAGVKMLGVCRGILEQAEKKIEMLIRDSQGDLKTQPADPRRLGEEEG